MLNGRLNNRKGAELNRQPIKLGSYDEYFICGPESMISEVSRGLRGVGVDEEHIHYELFAASAEDARQLWRNTTLAPGNTAANSSRVTVIMDGRGSQFD